MRANHPLLALLAATLTTTAAQVADPTKAQGTDRIRQRMIELLDEMKLTEEQRMQVRDIFESYGEELRSMRTNANLTAEQRMQQFKAIHEKLDSEMKRILNEQQYLIWKDEREKMQTALANWIGEQTRARMEQVWAELNLTDDQKQKLRELFASQGEKLKELRTNPDLTPEQRLQRLKALQDELEPQLKQILSQEQFATWQRKRTEMRERFLKPRQPPQTSQENIKPQ
ncbi:MAG: hypothetical protein N3B01_01500 [Verrucomicrobiae bacterium]|nr:hypothetical protein [Verrucomicrobiae bacterium]